MGFLAGKHRGFRLRWNKGSGQLDCTKGTPLSGAHNTPLQRERRFHRPRQALGIGYHAFDARLSAAAKSRSATAIMLDEAFVGATVPDREPLSQRKILHQVACSGMRICASVLALVVFCAFMQWIIVMLPLAAHAWL
jgi:hypothetical protein